jgi:hypothetical protein
MTTMRRAGGRWVVDGRVAVFSLAGAVPVMTTIRLPILVWFMMIPVGAMANKLHL